MLDRTYLSMHYECTNIVLVSVSFAELNLDYVFCLLSLDLLGRMESDIRFIQRL